MKTEVDFLSDFTLQLHVLFIRIVKSEIGEVSVHEYKECERDRKVALILKTIDFRVKGKVQGVFFRVFTRDTALNLGLVGWVKNLPVCPTLFAHRVTPR